MEKIILLCIVCLSSVFCAEQITTQIPSLEEACLQCHIKEQIPDELIYKRYLMKYSTTKKMKSAISVYLKNPKKEHSIMPPPFFLKFPMKTALVLKDEDLEHYIDAFLDRYDVRKKLVLP